MLNGYYQLFSELPGGDYETCVNFLKKELASALEGAYQEEFGNADIRHFNDTARRLYTLYFDCTEDNESTDFYSRSARVVFVFGLSAPATGIRNQKRMRQWLGAFRDQQEYTGYDKGHYIAHCNDGQVDQNLYPQLRELNRGISQQGKLYRSMERYLAQNPGVFYFVRPLYSDLTWIPDQIDFGIFTKEKGLLLNRFDNRAPKSGN